MRANRVFLGTLAATAAWSLFPPASAAPGVFYDPSNPLSPTGKTIGYELFRTIGCPGRELLGRPCEVPAGGVPPMASAADTPSAASAERAAAADSAAADDRAALAAGGAGSQQQAADADRSAAGTGSDDRAALAAGGASPSGDAAASTSGNDDRAAFAAGQQGAPGQQGEQGVTGAGESSMAAAGTGGEGSSGAPGSAAGTLVLEDIHFDFDTATLRADAIDRLQVAANTLQGDGGSSGSVGTGADTTGSTSGSASVFEGSGPIEVAGHADSTGPADYNMGLSLRRANAVRDYLVRQGVAADRLVVRGYGETRPTADNSTPEGRAKNRRVELLPQR